MFIDTHTHLFSESFNEDRTEVVKRAMDAGVQKMLLPNIDVASLQPMLDLHLQFPENCLPMYGLHPGSVGENVEADLSIIRKALDENRSKCVAIGEIGMDLYWNKTYLLEQQFAFREQIKWAKELQLPIVIHVREAFEELFTILDQENDERLTGVFHCFTGNLEQANYALNYGGFKLGIGGVLTYKKSDLPETLANIDLKHLVLETDSPFLPPTPFRGKRNESSYVLHVAEKLADIYNISLKDVEQVTTQNAIELFHL